MQRKKIVYQNSSIFYSVTGAGPRVVLLHGLGESGTVWQNQIDFLKDNFQLTVPDIPGSGQSEFIKNASIETYAEVIKTIIDTEIQAAENSISSSYFKTSNDSEKIGKTVLIGHSMGGCITLAFAEKYPQYLNGFGLFHSTAFADSAEKKEARLKAIEFIKSNGAVAFFKKSMPDLFSEEYQAKFPEKITALIEEGKTFTNEALVQYCEAMRDRPDRTAVLKNFNNPILFIIGEKDKAVPLQNSLQQSHLPLQAYIKILFSSAHMGMWEETNKADKAILDFLVNIF